MVFINMGTHMFPMGEAGVGVLSYILDSGVLPRVLKITLTLYKYETKKTDSIFKAQTWKIGKTQFKGNKHTNLL